MKNAFNTEIARSITQSVGRFVAIAVISLLGAGFYAGLRMAAPDMRIAGDDFYDATQTYDISVVSTLGLSDDSVELLRAVEGVGAVMPAHRYDALVEVGDGSHATVVESLPAAAPLSDTSDGMHAYSDDDAYLNRLILVEGSWPTAADECVVGQASAEKLGVTVGDTAVITECGDDVADRFEQDTYTVVGLVNAPTFLASGQMGITELGTGSVELCLYAPAEAFKTDEPYTVAYLSVPSARDELWDSAGYDDAVAQVVARVADQAPAVAEQRWSDVAVSAQADLNEARADYEAERADAEAELADAARDLADAAAQLESAQSDLASAKEQLDSSRTTLDASSQQLADGEAAYQEGVAQLEAQRDQLAPALAQLPELRQQYELLSQQPDADQQALAVLAAQIQQIEEGSAAIEAAQAQLAASRAELDAGAAQLAQGRAQYDEGLAQYESGVADYEQGLREYEQGLREYEDSKAEAEEGFADAERELADAQREIDDIEYPEVYVLDRTKNPGSASLASDADGITQIATFLPFMFFLVAALVALTSMTRMVDEERMDIGTHKALGYGKGRITSKYLVYGALASGVGAAVGIVALGKLLPWFILTSYQVSYAWPTTPLPIDPAVSARALGLTLGVTLIATWGAAAASLREKPAALMLPRVPKAGKRIFLERIGPLWSRLSFSHKVTARNLLRYKRRFFMAVVGVAGCTALLMVGFGLRDAIGGIVQNQYESLMTYDMAVQVNDEDAAAEDLQAVRALLDSDDVEAFLPVDDFNMIAQGPSDDMRVEVVVPSDVHALGSFVALRDRVSAEPIDLDADTIVLTEKAATELGAKVGDTVTLYDENDVGDKTGEGRSFVLGGIAENYLGHYAYLSPEAYEAAFSEAPSYSMNYVKLADGASADAMADALLANDAVTTVSIVADKIATYEEMLAIMDNLIVVIVLLSAALAFVVLYNLTNINITERVREIATLKVLGFTRGEVNAYIFREVIVMSLIGALLGCVLGVPLTFYIAEAAETANMMFGRSIEPASYVLSFVITIVFAVLVSFLMRHKLNRVNMVESLKSVE